MFVVYCMSHSGPKRRMLHKEKLRIKKEKDGNDDDVHDEGEEEK
jgi:hypothetical protein